MLAFFLILAISRMNYEGVTNHYRTINEGGDPDKMISISNPHPLCLEEG